MAAAGLACEAPSDDPVLARGKGEGARAAVHREYIEGAPIAPTMCNPWMQFDHAKKKNKNGTRPETQTMQQ